MLDARDERAQEVAKGSRVVTSVPNLMGGDAWGGFPVPSWPALPPLSTRTLENKKLNNRKSGAQFIIIHNCKLSAIKKKQIKRKIL